LFLFALGIVTHLEFFAEGTTMQTLPYGRVYAQQHYFAFYSVVLSLLLMHYYFDHFLFFGVDKKSRRRSLR
jgi:hypothetical protein